jgi:aminopeptidase N
VLRQAEHYVGEAAFRTAVRDFLERHAYGSAAWADLVRALERASGTRMKTWAEAWVKRAGMPRVRLERHLDGAGTLRQVTIRQEPVRGKASMWPMRIELAAQGTQGTQRYDVRLDSRQARIPTAGHSPDLLFGNAGDYGYGQFLLDAQSRDFALEHPAAIADPFLRSLVLDSLWESVREAEVDPQRYLELALAWLPSERDEMTGSVLLARLRTAYLRYLTPARRAAVQERVERFVHGQMQTATSLSRRIAYYRTYVDIARSADARAHLKALLAGAERIEGVTLRSRDRFRIIEALLALDDADAAKLLQAQIANDASSEARRYAFGAVAGRPDAAFKQALFERLLNDAQLPESWIEEALGPLNELDQARLTEPLLGPALQALPRLKRERKIFFVNEWLAAFIGGQSGSDALKTVRAFLAGTKLDRDLHLKVLEALDVLERTVKIRARYS